MQTVYLDYQATTPVDSRVLAAMQPYWAESFGNPHSSDHYFGWEAARAVDSARAQIAETVGADPDEVLFTSGATEANNLALLGLAKRAAAAKETRTRVLVSAIEHKSVLSVADALREQLGYTVEVLPVDQSGHVVFSRLQQALADDVLMVSVMAVNNEIGTIQDIRHISEAIRACGAVFHCDAAQAPLAMSLTGLAQETDCLSLSAHKMYGPKGIGALLVRRDLQKRIQPLIYGGGQQNGLRPGTLPAALCVGMGIAISLLQSDKSKLERDDLRCKRDRFIQALTALPWPVALNGSYDKDRHPGNANICFAGFAAHELLGTLQPHLAASTGSACSSGIPEPSHVLRAIGLSPERAECSIRFSLGRGTTDAELDRAVSLVREALKRLSNPEHD